MFYLCCMHVTCMENPLKHACTCRYMYNILAKEGPWAVHLTLGPRLGDGPIFEVSVSRLDAKELPSKLPTLSS